MSITKPQRGATHVWFRLMSEALNDGGFDMKRTLKEEIEIPWDSEGRNFKEHMYKPIAEAMFGVGSSEDLEPGDVGKVVEVMSRHLAQKIGINVPFPSAEPEYDCREGNIKAVKVARNSAARVLNTDFKATI